MTRRYTARDYASGLAHGARLLLKHRGDLGAVRAQLDAEKEWARFCARHGLPYDTDPATLDEYDRYLLDTWGPGSEWQQNGRRQPVRRPW